MNQLVKAVESRRQSGSMSRDRKEIYIGDSIRRALDGRKESLTTVVNLLIDRYNGLTDRAYTPTMVLHDDLVRHVLREAGEPLDARQIVMLPAMVEDYVKRHPEFPPEPAKTCLMILRECKYHDLLALVDKLERKL